MSLTLSRYYFPRWYNNSNSFYAHRYGVSKGMESPVMDDCVMAYQFFQVSLHHIDLNIKSGYILAFYIRIVSLLGLHDESEKRWPTHVLQM